MAGTKKTKWLAYTVGVGILPIGARLLANLLFNVEIEWFSATDFIAFGFVMHISILNELEHMSANKDWKTKMNFTSIGFVFVFGLLTLAQLTTEAVSTLLNANTLKYCSMIIAVVSFILAHSVFKRLSVQIEAPTSGEQPAC
ncbi:hypothetical protein D5E78_11720 [Vibrio parahaemolyticus]|nr:hypothetical protein D5E78_11720 [Vibrio parahaemolyticus]